MTVPTLHTSRLVLRVPTNDDFAAYAEVVTSERAQYMAGPYDRDGAWTAFTYDVATWILDGYGYWTAVETTSNEPVAFVGIAKPERFPEVELGWFTTAAAEGKGFAYEAAKAALRWGFNTRGLKTLVSYIDEQNARSIALAQRLEAVRDPDAERPDPEDIVFRHSAERWT